LALAVAMGEVIEIRHHSCTGASSTLAQLRLFDYRSLCCTSVDETTSAFNCD